LRPLKRPLNERPLNERKRPLNEKKGSFEV
jgi:hypothetical protein